MYRDASIAVIIPALNEEASIARVLGDIPEWVDQVIVSDNGSTDATAVVAGAAGARVVQVPLRGYGRACLAGIAAACDDAEILVFLDGDFSDYAEQMNRLVGPIVEGLADLVIGSRMLGRRERGSLTPVQQFGNALACRLIRWLWGHGYTDLGPFRAVRADLLAALRMDDPTYGWTIQMQIRALRAGLRVLEVPVDYRRRIGRSKISGTLAGVVRAGTKIMRTILEERWRPTPVVPLSPRQQHLIIFTRAPEPGRAKTRLIPALGADRAADLHRQMTLHTLAMADRFRTLGDVSVEIRSAGGSIADLSTEFGRDRLYLRQNRGDLGARLHGALADVFSRGASSVVVIGSDCPALEPESLASAFAALRERDLVLGPARDGGYYLVGLRRPCAPLFRGVDWGTGQVVEQTIGRARQLGLEPVLLPMLDDVDEPADLPVWAAHGERYLREGRIPLLSVIIPALNEEGFVSAAVDSAAGEEDVEVIVVDGGSSDRTASAASQCGAIVVRSAPGRARQMNAGAEASRGEALLFLHADTRLPRGYKARVLGALTPGVALAAFRLQIEPASPGLRWIARLANLRSRWLGLPYGDQAWALRAETFRQLGGFRELPIMEDFEFARRARRLGRIAILDVAVRTSARRWLAHGTGRTTLVNQLCVWGYVLGVPPRFLARLRDSHGDGQANGEQGPVFRDPIRTE